MTTDRNPAPSHRRLRQLHFVTAAAWCLLATSAIAQTSLTEEEIAEALNLGARKKFIAQRLDGSRNNPWNGWARGPFMRVVQLAAEAAEAKRPFTRADLTEETLAPVLTIELAPTNPLWRNTADAVMATMTRGFEIVIVPGPKPD